METASSATAPSEAAAAAGAPTPGPAAPADPSLPPASNRRRGRDFARLAGKALALGLGALLLLVVVVVAVPDGNDYALATRKKHARLAMDVPRKIVIVGGSNLAYGIDSALIERVTGTHVVNMGMNGYLGVRFMLEEVKPALRAGDVVVVALEYDSYWKSVEGTGRDLLMIAKANPAALGYLDWTQRYEVLKALPYAAQQKVLRLVREGLQRQPRKPRLIDKVESAAGFNEYGDLTSHLEVKWPYDQEDGIDLTHTPLDQEVGPLLQDFAREMQARGVDVVLSYTSAVETYYRRHKQSIDSLHALLTKLPPLVVPSPPTDFVYPTPWFFDTVYHLNAEGRAARSQKLAGDLQRHLKDRGAGGVFREQGEQPR